MLKTQIFTSLSLIISWINLARTQVYPFEKIGLEQGLPTLRINDFMEDSRGLFWIATEGAGLIGYDGFDFKAFNEEEQPERLFINDIEEDSKGNLWLAYKRGILKFDGKKYRNYSLPIQDGSATKIAVSRTGQLLVSTRRNQLYEMLHDSLKMVEIKQGQINDIRFSGHVLYLATSEGLYTYSNGELQPKGDPVVSLALANNDKIVAAFKDSVCEISVKGKVRNLFEAKSIALSAFENKIAIVSPRSFSIIKLEEKKLITFTDENGLPDEPFKGCFIDRSGVIWLYSDNGLTKLESTSLVYYSSPQFIDGEVFSVNFSEQGELYAATSKGLYKSNSSDLSLEMQNELSYGITLDMAEYNDYLWLSTEKGLIKFNGKELSKVDFSELSQNFIFSLHANKDGLWIGTGQGVFRYVRERLYNESRLNNLPFSTVYSISETNDGSLWFATYTEGLFCYRQNEWQVFKEMSGMRLDSLRFNAFAAVSANEIYVANPTEGLYHLSENNTNLLTAAQLNFAEIHSIEVDKDQHLWLGTNKGLLQVFYEDGNYRVRPVGFVSVACMPNSISLSDDHLAVGTTDGLLFLKRTEYNEVKAKPRLFLTDVKLFFGETEELYLFADDTLSFIQIPISLNLPHDKNFLSFNLSGLTGYQCNKLVYRYRLQGHSPDWVLAGNRREAVYSNLKPGHYQFEAQVKRSGESWSPYHVNYAFSIARPFWETWWFLSSLISALGMGAFLFIRDRINRINQRLKLENSLFEMERKTLRLQMNPHFIFNALDSINSLIFKKDLKQTVRYLNNFAKLMRLTLESSMKSIHPIETEVSILKNYLELEKLRFKDKFDYQIEIDKKIDYDVGVPPMLIQPHVENAILHGIKPKDGRGNLNIRFILNDSFLTCEIEDDGIGRKKSKEIKKKKGHHSMAITINRNRIKLLKKKKGKKIDIQIIDKTLPNGEEMGTLVRIQLLAEEI